MVKYIDLTDKKYNMLTVIEKVDTSLHGEAVWKCRCECGNFTNVRGSHLTRGSVKSCGCLRKVTGTDNRNYKHGMHNSRIYRIWALIKKRCYNKKDEHYPNYGGRGITVCDEWLHDFQAFYDWSMANGYADDLTIDRKDNDGNYEPGNCRWTTSKEQANNRRSTVHITVNGITKNTTDWAKTIGVGRSTIRRHIKKGDIEEYISSRL